MVANCTRHGGQGRPSLRASSAKKKSLPITVLYSQFSVVGIAEVSKNIGGSIGIHYGDMNSSESGVSFLAVGDFLTYIQRYTSPNENIEYGYPHFNALLQFRFELERCKPHKAIRNPRKSLWSYYYSSLRFLTHSGVIVKLHLSSNKG